MKFLYDFLSIFVFFVAYKLSNLYVATALMMVTSTGQVAFSWIKNKKVEKTQWITLCFILPLGTATLLFHNPIFIKWKPSIIYLVFATALLVTHGTQKPLIPRLLDQQITLPEGVWKQLNLAWCLFFIIMASANLYVAYTMSTEAWVYYKLFGTLTLTVLFSIAQAVFISYQLKKSKTQQAIK